MDEKGKLARAIGFGFENLVGKTLENVQIDQIDYNVMPKSANKEYIDFRVLGTENSESVKIGVAIIQYPTGQGVQAGLSRLTDYAKFDLTRGCLLRAKDISRTAKRAHQLIDLLLNQQGGEWPPMEAKTLRPLLAIRAVFDAREDYDVTEEDIKVFIDKNKIAETNPLLLEILSNPSGQIPNGLVDEDTISNDLTSTLGVLLDTKQKLALGDVESDEASDDLSSTLDSLLDSKQQLSLGSVA